MFFNKSKKTKDVFNLKLYAVYDCIGGHLVDFCEAQSAGFASRYFLSKLRYPLKDTQLVEFASVELKLPQIKKLDNTVIPGSFEKNYNVNLSLKVHSWDCYKFPETVNEALAPLNLSVSEIERISRDKIADKVSDKVGN